jgi:K+-sensing histidine kinase KdpD
MLTDAAGPRPRLPRADAGLPRRRRLIGYAVAVAGLPALTAVLVAVRDTVTRETVLLAYMLAVLLVAVIGGIGSALLAALGSFLLANWFLTAPYETLLVGNREALIDLIVLVVGAVLVSLSVELGARHRAQAVRHRLEARLVSRVSASSVHAGAAKQILDEMRSLFEMTTVALVPDGPDAQPAVVAGPEPIGPPSVSLSAADGLHLVAFGHTLLAEDRRLVGAMAAAAALAWRREELALEADRAQQLAETDRVRSALLATVSHDLRTPIAGIKAAVSGLREEGIVWTPEDSRQLLDTIERCADHLAALVDNLLSMSRIQAGAVAVHLGHVAVDEVLTGTLRSRGERGVHMEMPEDLPYVQADPALLERVLANLIANARRFTPYGQPVLVRGSLSDTRQGELRLEVIDHGPGVDPSRWEEMFAPFQRLGDREPGGVGLGLAIARGLTEAMGGRLQPSATSGGGLTMTLTLRTAP